MHGEVEERRATWRMLALEPDPSLPPLPPSLPDLTWLLLPIQSMSLGYSPGGKNQEPLGSCWG